MELLTLLLILIPIIGRFTDAWWCGNAGDCYYWGQPPYCVNSVCRDCVHDGNCPYPTKFYCLNNDCVQCRNDAECRALSSFGKFNNLVYKIYIL